MAAGAALADLYLSSRQPAKAMLVAQALVQRQPKEAQFQTILGITQAQSGDVAKARATYDLALKLDPNFEPAQLSMARLDVQVGAYDNAVKQLNAMLARNEKNVEVLIELGLIAQRRNQVDDASRYLEKAADHSGPRALRAALLLVDHYLRIGRPEGANEALNA